MTAKMTGGPMPDVSLAVILTAALPLEFFCFGSAAEKPVRSSRRRPDHRANGLWLAG
jgi:hypothetical protein